jgi:hypothetical protein
MKWTPEDVDRFYRDLDIAAWIAVLSIGLLVVFLVWPR